MKVILYKSDGRDALARALRAIRVKGAIISGEDLDLDLDGPWAYPEFNYRMQAAGVVLELTKCRLYLDPKSAVLQIDGKERPDRDLPILWCGEGAKVFCPQCHWFLQPEKFPGWNLQGLRFLDGGDWETHGGTAHGLTGSPKGDGHEVESFGVSSDGNPGRGIRASDWQFLECTGYASALMVGGRNPLPPGEGCPTVENIRVEGSGYWFGVSANVAPTDWADGPAVRFRDITVVGARFGFYNDTGSTSAELTNFTTASIEWTDIGLVGGNAADRREVIVRSGILSSDCATDQRGPATSRVVLTGETQCLGTRRGSVAGPSHLVIGDRRCFKAGSVWQISAGGQAVTL